MTRSQLKKIIKKIISENQNWRDNPDGEENQQATKQNDREKFSLKMMAQQNNEKSEEDLDLDESFAWPYYDLKGGYLYDEDGYKASEVKFSDAYEAEKWMEDNDVRGTIRENTTKKLRSIHEIQPMTEVMPPGFPKKLYHQLNNRYKTDTSKAYATMWKLHNKYGDKLNEMCK